MKTKKRFYAFNVNTHEYAKKNTSDIGKVRRTWASLSTLFAWIDSQVDDYAWLGMDSMGRFYGSEDCDGWEPHYN